MQEEMCSEPDKSAEQILDEIFTTLITAAPDAEPVPPGEEEQGPTQLVSMPPDPGEEEQSSKEKKKKKEKKSKKKKRKKEREEEEGTGEKKKKKKKKKDHQDEKKKEKSEEPRPKTADDAKVEPASKKRKTEAEAVEPRKEVAKPEEKSKSSNGHQEAKRDSRSRTSPSRSHQERRRKSSESDKKKERDESKRSREKEPSRTSKKSPAPSRRRSRSRSRSPFHSRRHPRRSSRSRSRSPPWRRGFNPLLRRSRSPPYRGRRRSSKSPIILKRPGQSDSPPKSPRIDKAQLLEAARQNLKRMQEMGTLPANLTLPASLGEPPPPTTVASKPTGKTVAELTDYCKNLVARPDDREGDESGNPPAYADSKDADATDGSSSARHPFQLKPRADPIVMNIRNAIPLPVRKPEERVSLKQQFPISSGQQHQDLEWVPVPVPPPEPQKDPASKKKAASKPNAAVAPTPRASLPPAEAPSVDIGTIVAKRISSIRKLQENEEDIEAQLELQEAEMMTQSWANYHHTNPLTGEPLPELINWSGAPQAWVRKDQFSSAAPVAGGVGMRLLQKMGWQPGEGLGRNKEGTLEPLALDIKTDKRGLLSKEEMAPSKAASTTKLIQEFQGKHPVSILHELCVKRRWEPPDFEQVADMGPDHLKHFLFKVRVNGIDYQPSVASTTKKEAKAQAAAVCLLSLGIPCSSSQH